jgi:hypothetical protein
MLSHFELSNLDEVRQRGYVLIGISLGAWHSSEVLDKSIKRLMKIAEEASKRGIGLQILTGYQRYVRNVLRNKPEWRIRFNDGSYGDEACPFNEEYKQLYIKALKMVAKIPNIFEIQLNDEAHLTNWHDKWGCYCENCQRKFREDTGYDVPTVPDWKSEAWRSWIKWRFHYWATIHKEFREAIKSVNPEINVSVQFTPYIDLYPWNPWFSGVDLVAIAENMDMLSVDPYHTYHLHDFKPDIIYLTEFTKFYKGVMAGKPFHIWVWGTVRPHNTRELTYKDGLWAGILPIAIGAFSTKSWSYEGMKQREKLLRAYEDTFAFDPIFEIVEPLKHVVVVHGFQTEVWLINGSYNLQLNKIPTYDKAYFRKICDFLREHHILYDHLFDKRLELRYLDGYRAVVLPRIACLSDSQVDAIKAFNKVGGGVLATYDTSLYNEEGHRRRDLGLNDVLKATVKDEKTLKTSGLKIVDPQHPIFNSIGVNKFSYESEALRVDAIDGGKVLATWIDSKGENTDMPAVIVSETNGRTVFVTAEQLLLSNEEGGKMFINAVQWIAKDESEVSISNAPSSIELFPSKGEDLYLATIASYMGDNATISLRVLKPTDKKLAFAEDLIERRFYEPKENGKFLEFNIPFQSEDAVKVVFVKFSAS